MKKNPENEHFFCFSTLWVRIFTQNTLPYFKLVVVIAQLALCVNADFAYAEEAPKQVTSEKYGFVATIPVGMEEVENTNPGVALALRTATAQPPADAFPTITLTIHPGSLTPKRGTAKSSADILESYRSVGIADAAIESETSLELFGGTTIQAIITYTNAGQPYKSAVTLIPALDHYFILTFIDHANNFALSRPIADLFLQKFSPGKLAPTPPKAATKLRDRLFLLFMSVIGIAALLGLILYQCRRSKQSPQNATRGT